MHITRELLDHKLSALHSVLPSIFADAGPEERELSFTRLCDALLLQCLPADREYALDRLAKIREASILSLD